jgi:DNA-binding transcriptional regulator YiaG
MPTPNFYLPGERCSARRRLSADSEELDEQALLGDLKRFVEETDLSIPRLAELMGVSGAILSMWIAGTAKPQRRKLLEVKGLLR